MKHLRKHKKLNRPTDQRLALLKSIVISLVENQKLVTTETRAKEASRLAERLITIAKTDDFNSRRRVMKLINNKAFTNQLFEVSKKYKDAKGGYTRIIKCGFRKGDAASLAVLELI